MSMIDERLTAISDCLYRVSAKIVVIKGHRLLTVIEPTGKYGLPGGGVDHGEAIITALKRELQEEIGLPANAITIDPMPSQILNDGITNGIPKLALLYKADLHDTGLLRHAEIRYAWVDAGSLRKVTLSNSIKSGREYLLSLLS